MFCKIKKMQNKPGLKLIFLYFSIIIQKKNIGKNLNCQQSTITSCFKNIVALLVSKATRCCMHVFLVRVIF